MKQKRLSVSALIIAIFLALCGISNAIVNHGGYSARSFAAVPLYWDSSTIGTTWGSDASTTNFTNYKTIWSPTSNKPVWGSKKSSKTYGNYTTKWGEDSQEEWGVPTNRKVKFGTGTYTTTWQAGTIWSPSIASSSAVYIVPKPDTKGALWDGRVDVTWGLNPSISTTSVATSTSFKRDLEVGSVGPDVLALQKFLNTQNFKISESGLGSPGDESDYFGEKTRVALAAFQASNGISPAEGYCGTTTRSVIKTMGWGEVEK